MRFTTSGAQPVALLGTSAPQQVARQRSQDSSIPPGSRGPAYPQEASSTLQRQATSAQALSKNRHIDRDPLVEEYYGQLLEEPEPSTLHGTVQSAQAETAADPPTELIFQLDRRGEGWGEEIFPTLTVIRRPVVAPPKRDRNRSKRPPPWTVSSCCCSLSCFLPVGFVCLLLSGSMLLRALLHLGACMSTMQPALPWPGVRRHLHASPTGATLCCHTGPG